jgi:hypothetical protein
MKTGPTATARRRRRRRRGPRTRMKREPGTTMKSCA